MSKRTQHITVRLTAAEMRAVRAEADRRRVAVAVIIREALAKRNTRNTPGPTCAGNSQPAN